MRITHHLLVGLHTGLHEGLHLVLYPPDWLLIHVALERTEFAALVGGSRSDTLKFHVVRDGLPALRHVAGGSGHFEVIGVDQKQET